MNYRDMSYRELQELCKERELKANGNTNKLIDRLFNADAGLEQEEEVEKVVPANYAGLAAHDANPDNPNWDMAGRWIRR